MNRKYLYAALFLLIGLGLGKGYSCFMSSQAKQDLVQSLEKIETPVAPQKKVKPAQSFSEEKIEVNIQGAVKNPGKYLIKKNLRLYDLIELAGGFHRGAEKRIKNYYLKNGSEFTIKYRREIQVEITGEIKKPGFYSMYEGDKLSALIERAGGLTSFGNRPEIDYYLKDRKKFFILKRRMQGESQ